MVGQVNDRTRVGVCRGNVSEVIVAQVHKRLDENEIAEKETNRRAFAIHCRKQAL